MPTKNVSIRIEADGSAGVQRELKQIGAAGEAGFGQVARAAERTGQVTEREAARYLKTYERLTAESEVLKMRADRNLLLANGAGVPASALTDRSGGAAPGRRGLSTVQRQTLLYAASDIVSSASTGINPAMIALQQGPQVLQAFALEAGKVRLGMILLGTAFAGAGAAALGAVAAYERHAAALGKLDIAARGLGATAGLSSGQLDALAINAAKVGGVSVSSARDMAAAYVSTGRIGGAAISQLIGLTRNYATTTGQDAAGATKELAAALADPAKGIDTLNGKLNFLDDTTYRYVQTLISQNRTTEAQQAILKALGPALLNAEDNITGLQRAWNAVSRAADGAFDSIGRAIDRALQGGPVEERLAELETRQRNLRSGLYGLVPFFRGKAAELQPEINKLRTELFTSARTQAEKRANAILIDTRGASDRYNPDAARLRGLTLDREKIQEGIRSGQLSPEGLKEARSALVSINKEIRAVGAGYSSAAAQATALGRASRSAAADSRKAERDAAREAREAAQDLQRQDELRLRNITELARLSGDEGLLAILGQEARLRSLIGEFEAAGLSNAGARVAAERQVSLELKAQADARTRQLIDETSGGDFVSAEKMMERFKGLSSTINENAAAMTEFKAAGERAFDILTTKLLLGRRAWGSWKEAGRDAILEVTSELVRLAAINPLKNLLFGGNSPTLKTGGGFLGKLLKGATSLFTKALVPGGGGYVSDLGSVNLGLGSRMPGFASGTESAPGGLAWVGERGPELVNLPRGAKVFDAGRSAAMARSQSLTVNVHLEGSVLSSEVQDWVRQGVEQAVGRANASVTPIVRDALARRQLA